MDGQKHLGCLDDLQTIITPNIKSTVISQHSQAGHITAATAV